MARNGASVPFILPLPCKGRRARGAGRPPFSLSLAGGGPGWGSRQGGRSMSGPGGAPAAGRNMRTGGTRNAD